ncbi:MAG: hypothetical protein AB7O65_07090 [Candidatus Korobacteraceae bacterium]
MRDRLKLAVVLGLSILSSTGVGFTQDSPHRTTETDLLARFSYGVNGVVAAPRTASETCFSVDRSGKYFLQRRAGIGRTVVLAGTLAEARRQELERMLDAPVFSSLESSGGGMLRSKMERFVAEVPREDKSQFLVWSNNDEQRPFPDAVRAVVNWLQNFSAEGAVGTKTYPAGICPVLGGFRPLT